MIGGNQPLFVIFTDLECRECRRGATQLAKLANMTQDSPMIGRIDCMKNPDVCNVFKDKDIKKQLPYMVFISEHSLYQYQGKIDAEEIFEWINMNQYKQNKKSFIHRNIDEYIAIGEQELRRKQFQKNAGQGSMIG